MQAGENLFELLDTNKDAKLSFEEVESFFESVDLRIPPNFFTDEDHDNDGFVSWHEFRGPKGSEPPRDQTAMGSPPVAGVETSIYGRAYCEVNVIRDPSKCHVGNFRRRCPIVCSGAWLSSDYSKTELD